MLNLAKICIALLVCTIAHTAAKAQSDQWLSLGGPPGAYVTDFAVNPKNLNELFVAVDGGGVAVYKSNDGGRTFSQSADGVSRPFGWRVYYDPNDDSNKSLFLTTWRPGLLRSSDGGASWTLLDVAKDQFTRELAFSSQDARKMYLAAFRSVHLSLDGGATWKQLFSGDLMWSIGINPSNDDHVMVGTWSVDPTVYETHDGGITWSEANEGLPNTNVNRIHFLDNGDILLGTDAGLFVRRNESLSWTAVSNGLPAVPINDIEVSIDDGLRIAVATRDGVYLKSNPLSPWTPLRGGERSRHAASVKFFEGGKRLGASFWGSVCFTSTVSEISWNCSSDGLPRIATVIDGSLQIKPTSPHPVIAGVFGGGMFRARTSSAQCQPLEWEEALGGPSQPQGGHAKELWMDHAPYPVFMGSDGEGLFVSYDDGATWIKVHETPDSIVSFQAIDKQAGRYIYSTEKENYVVQTDILGQRVQGLSGVPAFWQVAVSPDDNQRVYAVSRWAKGAFLSEDGGRTWRSIEQGLTNSDTRSIVVAPSNSALVFVGSSDGLFVSRDKGVSFQRTGKTLEGLSVDFLHVGFSKPDIVIAGTLDNGVFISRDLGMTFSPWNEGLPPNSQVVSSLNAHPADPNLLYMGTNTGAFCRRF